MGMPENVAEHLLYTNSDDHFKINKVSLNPLGPSPDPHDKCKFCKHERIWHWGCMDGSHICVVQFLSKLENNICKCRRFE